MKMLITQCKVEIIRILRNPYYVFWSLFMPILFYTLFTKIFNTGIGNQEEWQAHYLMSMTVFSVMGTSIMTLGIRLVEERAKGWSMFMRITPLSDSVYFISKMAGQTFIHVFSIVIIFLAGAIINGVKLSAVEWISSGLWILAASLPFLAIGTLIGNMKKVDTASGISNILYLGFAITGGLWMPIDILPEFIQNITTYLPAYNYGNGAWLLVKGELPEWSNVVILAAYLAVFMILSIYIRKKQEAAVG
ncbi:ABC transporter permease [Cytobacillus gottheilii]|uniref:ABC transporter permease n=1 Tax=Cytobacillus gottheilii TaxID=859144 RepID=A0ABX8FGB2_9BACI|nr:ABC transporter permease [Cytobacillus gottheilii]QVY63028.1 ABC transporter permease [Cytobacillus gottheilii]